MKVIKLLIFINLIVLASIMCITYWQSNGKYESIYLYPKDLYNKSPIVINTNQEHYKVVVKPGQSLGFIVEGILDEYLLARDIPAGSGKIDIAHAVYMIADIINIRSGDPDLIYVGEKLSFSLPKKFTIYQIDTVFEVKYYSVEKLRRTLNSLQWVEPYKAGYFDCSNMAGFLSMWLVRQGFDAYIVEGIRWEQKHSWIRVKVDAYKEKYVDVEATGLFVDNQSPKPISRRYRPWEKIQDDSLEYGWWHISDHPLMVRKIK
jgi:hypothetical protein